MTPDGHFVAFVGGTSNITQSLRVWDSQTAALVYAGNSVAPASLCISPDGNKIAFSVTNQLVVLNRIANSSVTAAPRLSAYQGRMQFSADGQFLVFGSSSIVVSGDTNNAYDVFIYDTVVGTTILVSRGYDSGIAANGWSDSPGISAEGRLVVYRSIASNIVPGDNNGLPDLFVYDRVTGSNSVFTASAYGRASANNWPMAANFSPDGHSLVFSSWASDLNQQDLNQFADVFSFRLLFADIAIQPSGQGPIIGWPALPGRGYAVQYKDDLNDPSWHPVSGTVSINGIRAMLQDLSPNAGQRFYRVTTF